MPTFSFPPDKCIEESQETKQYCLEVQNNSLEDCESYMSYSRDNHDNQVVALLETTEEIDDTMEESNDNDKVEEDGDLTVFPWYASNYLLN